jgi:hypothetical protein
MVQDGSLDFRLVQRVCALQQALDQALYSLEELRGQLQEQHWLESQLAKTEKYANVQQQAIAYLKSQLSHITGNQRHLIHLMAIHLEDWVDHQQVALNRLQLQIEQGEAELQGFLQHIRTQPDHHTDTASPSTLDLEAEVMVARSVTVSLGSQLQAARHQIQTLATVLHQHHADITQLANTLQTTLQATVVEMAETPGLTASDGETGWDAAPSPVALPEAIPPLPAADETDMLRHAVRVQQVRIRELETALTDQFSRQAQLKHRCQTLAAERDYYKRQWEAQQPSAIAPGEDEALEYDLSQYPRSRRLRLHPPPPIQPFQLDEGA